MASPPDSSNGRVTMAVLGEKVDTAIRKIEKLEASLCRRMDFIEERHALDASEIRAHCQENETKIARLEERQKATTGILGGLTLIASAIAGVVGSVFK